jgi:hypothetical protein
MKNKFITGSLLLLVLAIAPGCKKDLDRNPLSTNSQADFYNNAAQVQQALTGVYNAFGARTVSPGFNNPTPYYSKMDLFTELGHERGLNGTIASGAYSSTTGTVSELWTAFFQVVQRANNLLFYMNKAQSTMSEAEYKRVQAEAKVLRGLAYWHLIQYFGDVPFFSAPPSTPEEIYSFTRTDKKVIIDFLIEDLTASAVDLDWLPGQFGRVSRGVSLGTAARLAMLMGTNEYYTKAADLTDNIIANGPYALNPVYGNLFRKAGQTANVGNEIMFIYPYGDADPGSFNYLNLVQGSRNQGGQSSHFPSQFLVDLFECVDGRNIAESPLYNPARPNRNRDPRMKQTVIVPGDTVIVQGFTSMVFNINATVATFNTGTQAITFPSTTTNQDSLNAFGARQNGLGNYWRKYLQDRDINGTAGNFFKVGWVYMRYAEILLINAEAHLEKGSAASVVANAVNRVRARAGMPNVDPAILGSTQRLKALVRREKMVELANEGLHMADLRRWDDGAYAARIMPVQIYGQTTSNMRLTAGVGLEFTAPAAAPTFDATYEVPFDYTGSAARRLQRETRIYNANQHRLCPIPQGELDKNKSLTQNPGW